MIDAETKEHAKHWRRLAEQERKRPSWDKHYLPAIAAAKAEMFENAAKAIEKEAKTGIAHCACHLIPLQQCAELKAKKR